MEEAVVSSVAMSDIVTAELSIWGLFVASDLVVKVVMIILLFCSFWVWAVIVEKVLRLRRLDELTTGFEKRFWSGGSLEDLYDRTGDKPSHPMAMMFAAAMREWRRSSVSGARRVDAERGAHLQQRIVRAMEVTLAREQGQLERYMGYLASVGATAPFLGLFGTVWGIMNSFQSIAATKNTSLAVVAPGIAEALFATALGLVAAIPAVVAYNKLTNDINRYTDRLDNFATEFEAIVSRQLDEPRSVYGPDAVGPDAVGPDAVGPDAVGSDAVGKSA